MTQRVVLAAALFATALPAEAQRAREEAQLADERETLEQHGREVLHRGEPLQLVGVGAGDPGVLARTPALASATLGLVRVDRDELHARKLAMYDEGTRFDGAPRTLGPVTSTAVRDGARRTAPVDAEDSPTVAGSAPPTWPWVACTLAALGLALRLALVTRGRRPATPRAR